MASSMQKQQPNAAQAMAHAFNLFTGGFTTLLTHIGYRTGLWVAAASFTAENARCTSAQLAERANLNERYVREWLASMVVTGIFDYVPKDKTYQLLPSYAEVLIGGPVFSGYSAVISSMASNVNEYVKVFKHGGGLDYSYFKNWTVAMSEISYTSLKKYLVKDVLPLLKGSYKRLIAGERLHILDIGCGAGNAIILMATAFPTSEFYGYDFSSEAIQHATQLAKDANLKNAYFGLADAAHFDSRYWADNGTRKYDVICAFDAIHDQAHPAAVLSNIRKSLQPDGLFLMVDIMASSKLEENVNHKMGSFFYSMSTLHCMTVSLAQKGGVGLGTMWGEQLARSMLRDAGFNEIDVSEARDGKNYVYVSGTDVATAKL